MLVLNAIFPVFILLVLGKILKESNITNENFLKTSDKLVYYIFFPAMLFWKIAGSPPDMTTSFNLCLASVIAVLIIFLASLVFIRLFKITHFQAGSFSQASYRFNTYIGMAVIMNVLGEEGIRYFGLLVGIAIPIINVLAVSTLIWYSGEKKSPLAHAGRLGKALVSNPLILGCVTGLLYSKASLGFADFINTTFKLMTSVTMPLALLSIGGALTMKGIKEHAVVSSLAMILKLVALPVAGFYLLKALDVAGIAFTTGMIFFALPTSTALYVLSAQLNSDTKLASAAIMLSTVFSFISLSIVLIFWAG